MGAGQHTHARGNHDSYIKLSLSFFLEAAVYSEDAVGLASGIVLEASVKASNPGAELLE